MNGNQHDNAYAEESANPDSSGGRYDEDDLTKRVIGNRCTISPSATVGHPYDGWELPARIGDDSTVRSGTIIYADVEAGDSFKTGHNVLVREHTSFGDGVLVGTNVVIDGHTLIGDNASLQTGVYIPTNTTLGDRVFIGPGAVLTNDPYPIREEVELVGPTLEDDVSIGGNVTILPDVTVGERSFVAAAAVVTSDIPPDSLAIGAPAEVRPLPDRFGGGNQLG
nr:acyltransferase [Halomarina rubra]